MNIIDKGLVFDSSKLETRNVDIINTLYFHHEAGNGDVVVIHNEHKAKGWAGCGYNWVVLKNGEIQKGREIEYIPAGVQGYNTNSVHICFEGNFLTDTMTDEQKSSGKMLIDYVKSILPNIKTFKGHREDGQTSCPADRVVGGNFPLDELKSYALQTPYVNINYSNIKEVVNMNVIQIGERGQRAKIVQCLLVSQGYSLQIDGVFGAITQAQVKQFQRNKNLAVDGIVGDKTISSLLDCIHSELNN